MKKFAIIILTIALALSVSACKPKVVKPGPTTPTNTPGTSPSAPVGEGEVSTGFCIETSLSDSTDATADKGGAAKCESAFYAVTVDADGVIESCVIDAVQSTIEFSADGKLTTDTATEFPSKNELGKAYGLAQASPIGKEWNEQAKAFAQYCVGKTAQEVSGIAMTADGFICDDKDRRLRRRSRSGGKKCASAWRKAWGYAENYEHDQHLKQWGRHGRW